MTPDLSSIRNIGIAAHIDAGKTTTTERILFYTGKTHRMGDVDDGTTTTDFDTQEQERGITIFSAAVTCPWKESIINLIDTPGHVDFTAEVERSLRVLDGAVAVFDAKEGVEAQSETVWRQATRYNVPRICLINKMDKLGADFFESLRSIERRLHANPVAIQIPIGAADTFAGLIDLLTMQAVYYQVEKEGAQFEERPIPSELMPSARQWRHRLEEQVAETDDELMERYIHEEPISEDQLRRALRRATLSLQLYPVLCGSALRYIGVQRMLDAVVSFLPSPLDMPPVRAKEVPPAQGEKALPPDPDRPFAGFVFKVVAEKPVDLCFLRVYAGRLQSGTRVLNPVSNHRENVARIYRMFARRREQLTEALAGDIVAVAGPRTALTGHTLCDPRHPLLLEAIHFPEAVISQSVEPKTIKDRDKLGEELAALAREDPTFRVAVNEETGQLLISGMGELHLEVQLERLRRKRGMEVIVGQPRVNYRETITVAAQGEGKFVRQTGGRGQYAVIEIRLEPLGDEESDDDFVVENRVRGGAVRKQYLDSVADGLRAAATSGPLAGYKVINWRAILLDGKEHEVDSSDLAFENAGRLAFTETVTRAGPQLLEPIMKVRVETPDEHFGVINGDLNARRAVITGTDLRGHYRIIDAEVPLREMFGYVTDLRSLSQGRATSTMTPSRYAPVPASVARSILGKL